jgi:hypothetical protein
LTAPEKPDQTIPSARYRRPLAAVAGTFLLKQRFAIFGPHSAQLSVFHCPKVRCSFYTKEKEEETTSKKMSE